MALDKYILRKEHSHSDNSALILYDVATSICTNSVDLDVNILKATMTIYSYVIKTICILPKLQSASIYYFHAVLITILRPISEHYVSMRIYFHYT